MADRDRNLRDYDFLITDLTFKNTVDKAKTVKKDKANYRVVKYMKNIQQDNKH